MQHSEMAVHYLDLLRQLKDQLQLEVATKVQSEMLDSTMNLLSGPAFSSKLNFKA